MLDWVMLPPSPIPLFPNAIDPNKHFFLLKVYFRMHAFTYI